MMAEEKVQEKVEEKKEVKPEVKQKIEKSLKGKVWIKILAPKFFEEKFLGETLANEPEQVLNRTVEAGAFEFGNPEKFYFKIFFKVDGIDGSIARTKFFGHDCSRDFLARVVHYNATRIDTNDIVQLTEEEFVKKMISDELQQNIRAEVNKIYPLRAFEFRKSEVLE